MQCCLLDLKIVCAKGLKKVIPLTKMKVYAEVTIKGGDQIAVVQRTPTDKQGDTNPTWNCSMQFIVDKTAKQQNNLNLVVTLRSVGLVDRFVGEVIMPIKEMAPDKSFKSVRRQLGKNNGEVQFSYMFREMIQDGYQQSAPTPADQPSAVGTAFYAGDQPGANATHVMAQQPTAASYAGNQPGANAAYVVAQQPTSASYVGDQPPGANATHVMTASYAGDQPGANATHVVPHQPIAASYAGKPGANATHVVAQQPTAASYAGGQPGANANHVMAQQPNAASYVGGQPGANANHVMVHQPSAASYAGDQPGANATHVVGHQPTAFVTATIGNDQPSADATHVMATAAADQFITASHDVTPVGADQPSDVTASHVMAPVATHQPNAFMAAPYNPSHPFVGNPQGAPGYAYQQYHQQDHEGPGFWYLPQYPSQPGYGYQPPQNMPYNPAMQQPPRANIAANLVTGVGTTAIVHSIEDFVYARLFDGFNNDSGFDAGFDVGGLGN